MKYLHTIRARILYSCIVFIVILIAVITISMISINQKELIIRNLNNSNYNLSFISQLMNQDIGNIDTLAKWCSINDDVKAVLDAGSEMEWINTYDELKDIVQNNPSFGVLDRLIIMDRDMTRFMQYAPQSSIGKAIGQDLVLSEMPEINGRFTGIERSSFIYPYINVIKKVIPIIDYNTNEEIGYVYASISIDALLENLYSYADETGSTISLSIQDDSYIVSGHTLVKGETLSAESRKEYNPKELDEAVDAFTFREDGHRVYGISKELGTAGIVLSEILISRPLYLMTGSYAILTAASAILIIAAGALLAIFLNHLIVKPVRSLTRRLEAIGESDFSRDPSIESDDELGEIGHGINTMAMNIDALMQRKVEDEKKKQELEYRMLQNQINPHFLYNTLNSIKWMASIQHATGIAEMVTSLSRLMKTVSKANDQMIPLSEEIAFNREYMTIMRYRYGSSLEYKEEVDERTLDFIIPRFTLQPLLENAIFHGIEPKGAGCIVLKTELLENRSVRITILDNGSGFDAETAMERRSGGMFKSIGLENIRTRLEYAYNGRAIFEIESRIGEYTICRIILPGEDR